MCLGYRVRQRFAVWHSADGAASYCVGQIDRPPRESVDKESRPRNIKQRLQRFQRAVVSVAVSAAGSLSDFPYCGFRLETGEKVAKEAPLVERLPGTCGSASVTFKATSVTGMAGYCSPQALLP